ncbi:MAG TPA: hypothetical protein PLM75_06185, partial [bacterium]|nr:hypothetical protein [bacterium]
VELETKNDEDDEEETDDADNKKIAKSSKSSAASAIAITQKSDKINVENMRSSKKSAAVDKQPKKEIVQKKETAQIQYQPKERSAQFLAVIRKYNNNKQADIEAAYNEVKELVKSETDNVEALYMLGHLAYQKKKYDEAQQYFDIVIKTADLNDYYERQIRYWALNMRKNIVLHNNNAAEQPDTNLIRAQ